MKEKNKGMKKMTEFDARLEVTNFLNNNGFDEVTVDSDGNNDCDFTVRLGYWKELPFRLAEEMELELNVHLVEMVLEDDDCGHLYYYEFTVVDPDTGYTLNELNDLESNYTEEALYLESVGADDGWGVA